MLFHRRRDPRWQIGDDGARIGRRLLQMREHNRAHAPIEWDDARQQGDPRYPQHPDQALLLSGCQRRSAPTGVQQRGYVGFARGIHLA